MTTNLKLKPIVLNKISKTKEVKPLLLTKSTTTTINSSINSKSKTNSKPKQIRKPNKSKLKAMEDYKELEKNCNTYKESWSDWRKHLYEHGWCVVPNIITADKCDTYKSRFWDWIEHFNTGVRRNSRSTWTNDKWPGNIHGIFQGYAFGQSQFIWDIRSEPDIIKIFTEIYGTDKLLVSFDGGNLSRPVSNDRSKPWPHFDQSNEKVGFHCIQGFLNLEDCGDHDGGLIVYQDSHNKHDSYFKDTGIQTGGDWYKFDEDPNTLLHFKQCKKIKVNCKKGDVVLWDSRTIHYACAPTANKGSGECRTVIYVSYQPAYLANEKVIASKQNAFHNNRMTNHWAATCKLFPKTPRTYGNESIVDNFPFPENNTSVLNEIGRKLAGLDPYDANENDEYEEEEEQ